jgi:hypothetical protein
LFSTLLYKYYEKPMMDLRDKFKTVPKTIKTIKTNV